MSRHAEYVEMDAVEDLLSWEEESDALLPDGMTAEDIAELEQQGLIVDLETGEVFADPDAEVTR